MTLHQRQRRARVCQKQRWNFRVRRRAIPDITPSREKFMQLLVDKVWL